MEIERNILFNCSILSDKEAKSLEILELIRKKQVISRTDIAKITGINIVSISNYIKSYIDKKLVLERGYGESSGGRKPELVELNLKDNYAVGIEVSIGKIAIVLVDFEMKTISRSEMPVNDTNVKLQEDIIIAFVKEFIKNSTIAKEKIRAIGVGIFNSNFLPVCQNIEKQIGIPVCVAGHAACEAFGERRMNKAAESDTFLFIYSDLGRGIVIKDNACFGAIGSDGELGAKEPAYDRAHKNMFLEQAKYLNPWHKSLGLLYAAKNEVSRGVGTKIVELAAGKIDNITDDLIFRAAMDKDEVALGIVNSVGSNLGLRIAYLVNLFEPGAVVIGGTLKKAGGLLLNKVKDMVETFAFKRLYRNLKIEPSVLGIDAVNIGAASIAIREIFLKA